MLFGATRVWADSGLYLCGKEVPSTSDWYIDIHSDLDNVEMGSGFVSYVASTKTVTFKNAQAFVSGEDRILYNKNVPGLKIVFTGYSAYFLSHYCVFRFDVDTEIIDSTSGGLVLLQANGSGSQCIYCPNETQLIIRDFAKLQMTSQFWRAMETNGTHVTITNSRIYAEGADCAIQNNKGNDNIGWLHLDGCLIRDIWRECNGSVGERYEYGLGYRVHTDKAKSVMIILDEDYLGVRLKGVALTKGWSINTDTNNPSYGIEDCYTYDESTKTLTLKEDIQGRTEFDDDGYARYYYESSGILVEEAIDININGDGHFVSGLSGISFESGHIVSLSNMIIAGNYRHGVIIYSNLDSVIDLTLKDDLIIGGVEDAIFSQDSEAIVRFNPSAGKTVMLVPCDEDFKEATTFTYKPVSGCSIQLVDCIVTTPEGGEIGTNGFEVDGEKVKSKVVITGYEEYDLWVGETQVTSVNASDILGNGQFKYNASAKTLTVTNATLENTTDNRGGIYNYGIDGLTVNFVGTSTFNTQKCAIFSRKDITLSGSGSLRATSNSHCFCFNSTEDITCTISGPQLDLSSSDGSAMYDANLTTTVNAVGIDTRIVMNTTVKLLVWLKAFNLGDGLYVSSLLGIVFSPEMHTFSENGHGLVGYIVIEYEQNRKLGFSINGTEMTTLNINNVPGVESGSAYVSLNSNDEPTLVLNNATLDWNDANAALNLQFGKKLTIKVLGDCVINAPDHTGLDLSGNTTITGGGTLRINSKWAAICNWEDTRFTLQGNTTLIAYSSDSYGYCDEGYDYDQQKSWFIIEDGGLFAAFGKYGPVSFSDDRMIRFDSYTGVRYPIGGQLGNNYVYDADGNEVKNDWAVIGPDTQATDELIDSLTSSSLRGDVNLDKTVDIADAVCVLNAMAGQPVAGDANVNGDTDANGNPVIDIADLVTVLNIMAGR